MDYDDLTEFDDESLAMAYTVGEIELRRKFAVAYLQIGDPVKALLSVHNIPYSMAAYHGRLFLNEPFVKHLLKVEKVRLEANDDQEGFEEVLRKEILTAYRTVMSDVNSKGSEVVSAASKLAEMFGFNAPAKSSVTHDYTGGVMRLPVLVGADGKVLEGDAFSDYAQKEQQRLRNQVLESVAATEE